MNQIYQLMYRSFEEQLNPQEQAMLQNALQNDLQLQTEYHKLLKLRAALANHQFDFEPDFAERVMRAVSAEETAIYTYKHNLDAQLTFTFKRLAVACAAAMVILLGITYYQQQSLSIAALTGLNKYNPDDIELLNSIDI